MSTSSDRRTPGSQERDILYRSPTRTHHVSLYKQVVFVWSRCEREVTEAWLNAVHPEAYWQKGLNGWWDGYNTQRVIVTESRILRQWTLEAATYRLLKQGADLQRRFELSVVSEATVLYIVFEGEREYLNAVSDISKYDGDIDVYGCEVINPSYTVTRELFNKTKHYHASISEHHSV